MVFSLSEIQEYAFTSSAASKKKERTKLREHQINILYCSWLAESFPKVVRRVVNKTRDESFTSMMNGRYKNL